MTAEESTHSDRVVRTWSDVGGGRISGRRLGIRRVKRYHRCSFNGHFYNHKAGHYALFIYCACTRHTFLLVKPVFLSKQTAVFTPAFGSVTNVRINSCMTTAQVMRVLLNKFKIENSPDEFSLYLVHTSGGISLHKQSLNTYSHLWNTTRHICICIVHAERHQLKPNDHPLAVRVLQGPCEQVSKIFLMEMDQVEEVTHDVSEQTSQLKQ